MTSPVPPHMTGLVLAGGRSSRMGQDKAVLRLGGRRLVDIVVGILTPVCSEVFVAAGDRAIPELDVRQIRDGGDAGPLGGIVAGLAAASTDLVAVVAVDMPFADGSLLVRLAEQWVDEVAVVPRTGERLQPLHAVYAKHAQRPLNASLRRGQRSPAHALIDLGARVVAVDDDRFAHNVNRAADLAALEAAEPTQSL